MSLLDNGKFSLASPSTSLLYKVGTTGKATNYLDFFSGSSGTQEISLKLLSEKQNRQKQISFTDILLFSFLFPLFSLLFLCLATPTEEDGHSELG